MWWLTLARAQDGGDEPSETILVEDRAVELAREQVIASIEALGYDEQRDRRGRTVFLHEDGWKGKVVLFDDGRLDTRRRGLSGREVEPIAGTRIRPYFLCLVQPTYCVDAGSWYLSERKWRTLEDDVARATAAPLGTLGDRMADRNVAQKAAELPAALDLLWTTGAPVDGGPPLATWPERRAALLELWDTRTETEWGQVIRDTIAAFVRGEVEASDHPYTAEERERFEATRRSSRPFPWSAATEGGPPEP